MPKIFVHVMLMFTFFSNFSLQSALSIQNINVIKDTGELLIELNAQIDIYGYRVQIFEGVTGYLALETTLLEPPSLTEITVPIQNLDDGKYKVTVTALDTYGAELALASSTVNYKKNVVTLTTTTLASATFILILTGQSQETIEGERLRDDTNGSEHILYLHDPFLGFGVSLYFPFDITAGTYEIEPYIVRPSAERVSATLTTPTTGVYQAREGTLTIESRQNGTITGVFSFIAFQSSQDRSYEIQGAFNQLPLESQ